MMLILIPMHLQYIESIHYSPYSRKASGDHSTCSCIERNQTVIADMQRKIPQTSLLNTQMNSQQDAVTNGVCVCVCVRSRRVVRKWRWETTMNKTQVCMFHCLNAETVLVSKKASQVGRKTER